MFPSSAAMLKNLQQSAMASPSFLMENLLQSKSGVNTGAADLTSLTLNWAASLVARQRERESEANNIALRQQQQQQQQQNENRLQQRSRLTAEELYGCPGNGQDEDCQGASAIDRLSALSERLENRSIDSNNSMDEDRASSELDVPEFTRHQQGLVGGGCGGSGGGGGGNGNQGGQGYCGQQQQQSEIDINSRISEETCSCGEEQCAGGRSCRRIHQHKEKPQLKFSVNAILGNEHERRANNGMDFYCLFNRFFFFFSFLLCGGLSGLQKIFWWSLRCIFWGCGT
ncbi:hypothetical protein QAD02_008789 [Eretmocerus hayati]|uniref:Uncharacterized protein n=1 Tax=Eretmocerus hayati TaxID=131215 RepID=A0ACC2N7J3_9HYME|nr:hypothetical protein QAD02_008789 [Eretmocerus hayati]